MSPIIESTINGGIDLLLSLSTDAREEIIAKAAHKVAGAVKSSDNRIDDKLVAAAAPMLQDFADQVGKRLAPLGGASSE